MSAGGMQLALGLAAAPPASRSRTAGQAKRLPGPAPEDTPTIHDPAQLSFAFAKETAQ
jgi:hypothetical protein